MSPNNNRQKPEQIAIGDLLTTDTYRIPMYQRNYAWEEGEITQLIRDVTDYQKYYPAQNYYIGTLIVFKHLDGVYETIDGQQRLTTLTLLAAWLKNKPVTFFPSTGQWPVQPNLSFENRTNSQATLEVISKGGLKPLAENPINCALHNGYKIIDRVLPRLVAENNLNNFAEYLLTKVQIMRIEVPPDTDLNHYFEIMNSRGEQLEKHEVLKAKLLAVLEGGINEPDIKAHKACLNLIWEACANMERYVQAGFTPTQRTAVFGNGWNILDISNFDTLRQKLYPNQVIAEATNTNTPSLSEIIKRSIAQNDKNEEKNEDMLQRFNSVINFPNFLLQVLCIYLNSIKELGSSIVDIPLDDKCLLSIFEQYLLDDDQNKVKQVKDFAFALLRCKYLYDHYIIKREFIHEKDGWSLKLYKRSDGKPSYVNTFGENEDSNNKNRKVLMLLAAFHVSTPTLAYKHWLSGTLNWLYGQSTLISADDYLQALESLAKAFMCNRFLTNTKKKYSEIIFEKYGKPTGACTNQDMWLSYLSYNNIENNFVFNYLDYLLWKENRAQANKDSEIDKFTFTFRSSVEHFYPQHPIGENSSWKGTLLNTFGNLCLISHAKNARLSNHMPKTKKDSYAKGSIDSIKQYQMMKAIDKNGDWNKETMKKHQKEMIEILTAALTDQIIQKPAQ